jgi:cytochrome c2
MKTRVAVFLPLVPIFSLAFMLRTPAAQVKVVPGSVVRGQMILKSKGCVDCHDFSKPSAQTVMPSLLAAEMWNHMPKMWAAFETAKRPAITLTSDEAADLFAYFYATLYFAPQGDASRGRSVFEKKNCSVCHSEVLSGRSSKSIVESWTELRDPIAWAERMWNHASEMDAAMSNRGLKWPQLSGQDVVDLIVFLSKLSDASAQPAAFGIGEPERGRHVFQDACETCHSFGPAGASKVDLLARPRPASVMGYIATMWNHAPAMRKLGGATAKLDEGAMSDLIAYLFTQRFFFEQGDPAHGRAVYEAKGCVTCHDTRRKELGAPDLAHAAEAFSPITLTAAAWRHGPSMQSAMKKQGISWPEFHGSEMSDLIAYLNSRLLVRVAD